MANLPFEFFPIETSTVRLSFSSKYSPRITCFSLMTLVLFSTSHWTAAKTILIWLWKWNPPKRMSDQPVTLNSKMGAKRERIKQSLSRSVTRIVTWKFACCDWLSWSAEERMETGEEGERDWQWGCWTRRFRCHICFPFHAVLVVLFWKMDLASKGKNYKLFTKKSRRKMERTLTGWSVPSGCQDNKGLRVT